MIYPKRKDYSLRSTKHKNPPFSLNPNQKLDTFCIGIMHHSVFQYLSLEEIGVYLGLITWSTYWGSAHNYYEDSPDFSPKNFKFWSKIFRISSKKMQKIAQELEKNSLIKITENQTILLNDFHYKEEIR